MCVVSTTKLLYLKHVAFKLVKHTTQTYYSSRIKVRHYPTHTTRLLGRDFPHNGDFVGSVPCLALASYYLVVQN